MSNKNGKNVLYVGFMQVVPSNVSTPKKGNQSVNSKTSMSRTAYNDKDYKVTNRHTKTYKSGDYVTKSGSHGYKEEKRATSTFKVTDKKKGFTTEFQTQVNVKKMVYPTTSKSHSNKRITYY